MTHRPLTPSPRSRRGRNGRVIGNGAVPDIRENTWEATCLINPVTRSDA